MERTVLEFRTTWYKWSDYVVTDGIIRPTGETAIEYDPFKHFSDNMKMNKPLYVANPDENHIHTSFACINTDSIEDMLAWVKAYGVPYSVYCDSEGNHWRNYPKVPSDPKGHLIDYIRIDDFVGNVKVFRSLIRLYNALQPETKDMQYIRRVVSSQIFYRNFQFLEQKLPYINPTAAHRAAWMQLLEELWARTPAVKGNLESYDNSRDLLAECGGAEGLAKSYIALCLDVATQSVREVSGFDGTQVKVSYRFGSLLALLYKMLLLEWTKGNAIRSCADPSCGRLFIPYTIKSIYCAEECCNRVKQRTHRAKISKKNVEKMGGMNQPQTP